MKKTLLGALLLSLVLAASPLWAATTNLVVRPDYIGVSGAAVVGVDGDSPGGPASSGSWQAGGSTWTQVIFTPQQLFGRDVTVGELASISYYTKKGTTHTVSASDWYFQIYTVKYTGSPYWYGYRLGAEPYFSQNLNAPADQWNLWQTDEGSTNRLRFFDSSGNAYFGGYNDGFLSDFTGDAKYAEESIMRLVLGTGSGWASGFTGQLDGLSVVLANGDTANVNFESEVVPEPMTMILGAMGLGSIVGFRRFRK